MSEGQEKEQRGDDVSCVMVEEEKEEEEELVIQWKVGVFILTYWHYK